MAVYYGTNTTVSQSIATEGFLFDTSPDTAGDLITISLTAGETRSMLWVTSLLPNNDSWESGGTQSFNLRINGARKNVRGRCKVGRTNSALTTDLQSGAFTGWTTFSAGGDHSFSPVSPTWTSGEEACSNRYYIYFEFENLDTMMSGDIELLMNASDVAYCQVTTDISENTGSCTGGATTVVYIIS